MFDFNLSLLYFVAYLWLSLADNITTDYPCFNCSDYNSSSVITTLYNSTTTTFFTETDETDGACTKLVCRNGGTCIIDYDVEHCICREHFHGDECDTHHVPAKAKTPWELIASMFGLMGTIMVFIALMILLIHFSRKAKLRKEKMKLISDSLSNDFTKVNKQLEVMTMDDQMQLLDRLSKLIDATARAALMTYPSIATVEGGKSDRTSCDDNRSYGSRISFSSYRRFSAPFLLDPVNEEPECGQRGMVSPRESMRFVSI